MRGLALAGTMLTALCGGAQAADQVKLGLMTPLSGPISPAGAETKRGVDLALEELGNKLGGLPVKYTVVDDKTNPAEAVQGASKLIDDAKVDFVTGFSASNTMIPVWKTFNDAGVFAVGALAGPLQFAGKDCVQNGFVVSFSNDDWPAAVGKYMTDKGVKKRVLHRRRLSGRLRARRRRHEVFQGQGHRPGLHAADAARLRPGNRAHPRREAGCGVRFPGRRRRRRLRQAVRAGRPAEPNPASTAEDPVANPLTFPAQGDAAIGIVMGTNWTADLDNAANKKFVAAFSAKYNRLPATFAALGYDAVKLIDSAVKDVGGKIENKDAVRAALQQGQLPVGAWLVQVQQQPLPDPRPSTSWR